jgi:hypothetical protein
MRIKFQDSEVANNAEITAHAAVHLLAFEHTTGILSLTSCTQRTMS